MKSGTSVEQILGRILRLPYCKLREDDNLNKAYAFVTSNKFAETAKSLIDALVDNGFNHQEASEFIKVHQPNLPDLSLDMGRYQAIQRIIQLPEVPNPKDLPESLREKVSIDATQRTVTLKQYITPDEEEAFKQRLVMADAQGHFSSEVAKHRDESIEIFKCPSERKEFFEVPQLYVQDDDLFESFEEQTLLDYGWEISNFDAKLTQAEFEAFMEEESRQGEINVSDDGRLSHKFISELNREMMLIDIEDEPWTEGEVVYWLDRELAHYFELTPQDKEIFLNALVGNLLDDRNIHLTQLVRKRFKLRKVVDNKIKEYKKEARSFAYQELLFGDDALEASVSTDNSFKFNPDQYPARYFCENSSIFQKHYYPRPGELSGSGEEFECACFLDSLDEVEYWVRNLERQPLFSFWLQTATDKFYPDFVCKLKDGRILVVEYKGSHLWSNDDSKEKRRLGELWEAKSNGQCLFIMPEGFKIEVIREKIRCR